MTTDTVLLDHRPRFFFHNDVLRLEPEGECCGMSQSVGCFEKIFAEDVVVRHMAIVAGGYAEMRIVCPVGILGIHDMAVDACLRVVAEIGPCLGEIESIYAKSAENTEKSGDRHTPWQGRDKPVNEFFHPEREMNLFVISLTKLKKNCVFSAIIIRRIINGVNRCRCDTSLEVLRRNGRMVIFSVNGNLSELCTIKNHPMKNTDPRIDRYIENAAPFAQPILAHLRGLIHKACPEAEEKIKWNFPHFDYKGVFVSMAAFREHCGFTFWKMKLMKDPKNLFKSDDEKSMGHLGKIRSMKDLPSDKILLEYLAEAKKLNDEGKKLTPKMPADKGKNEPEIPADLLSAMKKNKKAQTFFEKFPYSHKKEYIQWITGAKADATRKKRIETAVQWIAEGKERNWKYK
jgi:uncharacterized protein YdeI (YjbR/CyaY-like superfamily)